MHIYPVFKSISLRSRLTLYYKAIPLGVSVKTNMEMFMVFGSKFFLVSNCSGTSIIYSFVSTDMVLVYLLATLESITTICIPIGNSAHIYKSIKHTSFGLAEEISH